MGLDVGGIFIPCGAGIGAISRSLRAADNVIEEVLPRGDLVIGKMDDLAQATGWRVGDYTLNLPPLPPGPGRWEQNRARLQEAIDQGLPIRDISPSLGGGFLERERQLLIDNGWTFDPNSGMWSP